MELIRVRKIARPEIEGLADPRDPNIGVIWEPIPETVVTPATEPDAPPQTNADVQTLVDAGLTVEDAERLAGKKASKKAGKKGNDLSAYETPIKG